MDDVNGKLNFPQFDVVANLSDHLFLSRNPKPWKPNDSCLKAIYKNWRILQDNLPDSIYVRFCKTRLDILSVAIIGATGTPYHDGVFFFDIVLPPNYPVSPPKVRYRTLGYPTNPLIDKDNGNILMSLQPTWLDHILNWVIMGPSYEMTWNAKQSSLLQLLLLLQNVFLAEQPGTYLHKRGTQVACQSSFLYTCITAIRLIRNPPKNFEPLIHHHYRKRANAILSACEAYANGRIMMGLYGFDGIDPPDFFISSQIQVNMDLVYSLLLQEFRGIKADVMSAPERVVVMTPNLDEGRGKWSSTCLGQSSCGRDIVAERHILALIPKPIGVSSSNSKRHTSIWRGKLRSQEDDNDLKIIPY